MKQHLPPELVEPFVADAIREAGGTSSLLDLLVRHDFTAFAHMVVKLLLGSEAPPRLLWHVQAMGNVVEEVYQGECRRLIVTAPPRHLKSIVTTIAQIAWRLGRDPRIKILLVSYAKELSKDLLGRVRSVLAHPWYRSAFPGVTEGLRVNRADLLETRQGGKVIASSFSAGFTGMGADLIIVDDPLRAQSAFSERQRSRCNSTFDEGLRSRLDDPAHGAIVVVMQRLHEEDLVGHLRAQGDWRELRLPLVAEAREEVPLGRGRHERRVPGTTIDPIRVPPALATEIGRAVGSVVFTAQYQQEPQPAEGTLLRLGNVGTYRQRLSEYDEVVIAVDTALETGEGNDFTACVVLGRSGHRIHVLQVELDRIPFIEQVMLLCALNREYPGAQILVEAANSGIALIQELRRMYGLHVSPASVRRSKEQRAVSVAALLENGDVCVPEQADWLSAFLREVRSFPHGATDDMVDAFVHGLRFLKRHLERERAPQPRAPIARPAARPRPRSRLRPAGAVSRP
jgi:predicted phage terminase large subunit-like protein